MLMKLGDLIVDFGDGDIGLVMSEIRDNDVSFCGKHVMVLWPSNEGKPVQMDMRAVKNGWVEVISESR